MSNVVSELLLLQAQELWELRRADDADRSLECIAALEEQICELRCENSNLRAALELKEIELDRCRAVQECEKERAKEKDSEKNDQGSKLSRDRLEKMEFQRKMANLKKDNEEKDVEIRQLKNKLATAKESHKKQMEAESMKHQQEIFILQQLLKEARTATSP